MSKKTPIIASRLARIDDMHPLPTAGSLIDLTLKAMAADWDFIAEYEQLNLASLPIRWKTALLTYLGTYAPVHSVTVSSLKTLFLTQDELQDATGGEDLVRLDMTGLICDTFTISDLERFLYRKNQVEENTRTSTDELAPRLAKIASTMDEVVDSWEDADVLDHQPVLRLKIKRFPNLTRLSLANAGSHASWAQLLSLTTHLPTLTHLSLAYWPLPTTTPNSKTAFITHNHASIPVSGTHFYNRMDDDWAEASSILKRLSRNLYRLQWLDLEGCADWIPALTWASPDDQPPRDRWVDRTFRRANNLDSRTANAVDQVFAFGMSQSGPDWTGSWSQLKYVNISQGIIPRDVAAVRAWPAGVVAAELLLWLRDDENTKEEDVMKSRGVDVQQWLQREKEARAVVALVRTLRASAGATYCEFDHGWTRPVAAAAAVFKGAKTVS
jgi:hypothetical protein